MRARFSQIKVARVLHEDDEFMTLEVIKHNNHELTLKTDDRFLSIAFVRSTGEGEAEIWLPWENAS